MTENKVLSRLPKTKNAMISYSMKDIEEMLGISHATLDGLIKSKKLRSFKVGRRRLITAKALADFIDNSENEEAENV